MKVVKVKRKLGLRKGTIPICMLLSILFVGCFFGVRHFSLHAETVVTHGVVKYINQVSKTPNYNMSKGTDEDLGKKTDPFLILEIVPCYSKAEIGYFIDGCEPLNYKKICGGYNLNSLGSNFMAISPVQQVLPWETHPSGWKEVKNDNEITLLGYYEKVKPGHGRYQYDGSYADNWLVSGETVYRPKFKEVGDEKGDFIWVTTGNQNNGSDYIDKRKHKDNKYSTDASKPVVMNIGDREYTSIKTRDYYYCNQEGGTPADAKFVNYNDFIRDSIGVRDIDEVKEYNVLVKTIEPWELNENPEWIDKANLVMIKQNSYGSVTDSWWRDNINDPNKKDLFNIRTDTHTYEGMPGYGYGDDGHCNGKYSRNGGVQNDISAEVALKLFEKVNGLGQYKEYEEAPLIMENNIHDSPGGYESGRYTAKLLDYETMQEKGNRTFDETGFNNNMYKFSLMDLLMNQDNFYNLFMRELDATGKPAIQVINNELCMTAHTQKEAQIYWSYHTFLPYCEDEANKDWANNPEMQEYIKKYGLNFENNNFINPTRNSLLDGGTFTYLQDFLQQWAISNEKVNYDKSADTAEEWFADPDKYHYYDANQENHPKNVLSLDDMIYYLLHYKHTKGGDDAKRKILNMRVLELEPCSEYVVTSTYLRAQIPGTVYSGNYSVTHMTTEEFNTRQDDVNSSYDLIIVGDKYGKFNYDESNEVIKYNDSNMKDYVYSHVGDSMTAGTKYRLSGNDITKLRLDDLRQFVDGGHMVAFMDDIYSFYKMDSTTNIYKFLKEEKKNVKKSIKTAVKSVSIDSNKVDVTEGTKEIKDKNGNLEKIIKTTISADPKDSTKKIVKTQETIYYYDVSNVTDMWGRIGDFIYDMGPKITVNKNPKIVSSTTAENGKALTFTFTLAATRQKEQYSAKILLDMNNDGVLSDDASGSEVIYDSISSGSTQAGSTKPQYYKTAETDQSYSVTVDIPDTVTAGDLMWKVMLCQKDNEAVYSGKSGSVHYGKKQEDLNVLQIVESEITNAKGKEQGELVESLNENGLFKKYRDQVSDYNIIVTTMSMKDYINNFDSANKEGGTGVKFTVNNSINGTEGATKYNCPNNVDGYDVLLIDCVQGLQSQLESNVAGAEAAVSYITYRADNGQSVVFTKETILDKNSSSVLQQKLKDCLAQCRYTGSEYQDSPVYSASSGAENKYVQSADLKLEDTYYSILQKTGVSANTYLPFNNNKWMAVDGETKMSATNEKQMASCIKKANDGTITGYPFDITGDVSGDVDTDLVSIAKAEAQNFQVNLENPNVTVWYCLGGASDKKGKDLKTTYAISPVDGWNNYYLYTVGNVTYDGINLMKANSLGKDMEMKLFINTLVAAKRVNYAQPSVKVTEIKTKAGASLPCITDTPNEEELVGKEYWTKNGESDLAESINNELWHNYTLAVKSESKDGDSDITYFEYKPKKSEAEERAPLYTEELNKKDDSSSSSSEDDDSDVDTDTNEDYVEQTVYENHTGVTGNSFSAYASSDAWLEKITNTDEISFTYYSKDATTSEGQPVLMWKGTKKNNSDAEFSESTSYYKAGENPKESRTVTATVSEIKSALGFADTDSFGKLVLFNIDRDACHLTKVVVRRKVTSDDPLVEKPDQEIASKPNEKEVANPSGGTHRIYFSPFDGNRVRTPIWYFKAYQLKSDEANNIVKKKMINTIYHQYQDKEGNTHIAELKGHNGVYEALKGNYLWSSDQYFFLYNRTDSGKYPYIELDIKNKKRAGGALINLKQQIERKHEKVYLFQLD